MHRRLVAKSRFELTAYAPSHPQNLKKNSLFPFLSTFPYSPQHDLHVSFAPNSVWLQRNALNKAVPLRWLLGLTPVTDVAQPSHHGCIQGPCAIALGDSPHENDGPMGDFVEHGLEFISMAASEAIVPERFRANHVGGKEHGAAVFLQHLMEALETAAGSGTVAEKEHRRNPQGLRIQPSVKSAVEKAKSQLAKDQHRSHEERSHSHHKLLAPEQQAPAAKRPAVSNA